MRINLPSNTPANIVQRIRAVAHNEQLFNAHFPRTISISTRNTSGIVTFSGDGSDCVEARRFFTWVINELRESGAFQS